MQFPQKFERYPLIASRGFPSKYASCSSVPESEEPSVGRDARELVAGLVQRGHEPHEPPGRRDDLAVDLEVLPPDGQGYARGIRKQAVRQAKYRVLRRLREELNGLG